MINGKIDSGNQPQHLNDEISLFDIWNLIVRSKRLVLGVWGLTIIITVGVAFMRSPTYEYSASLRVAGFEGVGDFTPAMPPTLIVKKIRLIYLPHLVQKMSVGLPSGFGPESVTITISNNKDDVIDFSAKARQAQGKAITNLLSELVSETARLSSKAGDRLVEQLRQNLELTNQLLAKSDLKSEKSSVLMEKLLLADGGGPSIALRALDIRQRLSEYRTAEPIGPVIMSQRPIGTKRGVLIALGVIGGLLLALFALFVSEFLKSAKCYREEGL